MFRNNLYKNKSVNEPQKAAFWYAVCNVMQKGIFFLTTPIFTRLLTKEEYGVYSIYMSWYAVISIFTTLNLSSGVYNKGLVKYNDKDVLTSSFLGLSTIATFVFLVLYIINIPFWNKIFALDSPYILLIFLESFFQPAFLLWSVKERFDYKYKKILIITVIMSLLNPILGIIAINNFNDRAFARIVSYVIVEIVVGLIFYTITVLKGKKLFSKKYWKYALNFNLPLIPHYLSMTVLSQADRIMIGRMVGSGEAAMYSVAYAISSMMQIITNAINNSYVPYTYKALRDKEYGNITKSANMLLIGVASLCIISMIIGPELILIAGGSQYYRAVWIIPPVSASIYFMFLYPLFGNIEFYYEKTKFVMIASSIGAVLNIVLNSIFIKLFGFVAAGYTTLVCYILFAFAHYIFSRITLKKKNINQKIYDMRFVVILSLLVLILMGVMIISYKYVLLRISVAIVIIAILILKRKSIYNLINVHH